MFSHKIYYSLFLGLMIIFAIPAEGQVMAEAELKAALLYKFVLFTEGLLVRHSQYVFCVLGKDSLEGALNGIAGNKPLNFEIVVNYPSSASEAKECNVVFLNPRNLTQLSEWLAALKQVPVLTVSDQPEAWDKGTMIVFVVEPNRITFSVNATVAKESGIQFRSQMLQLAQEIR